MTTIQINIDQDKPSTSPKGYINYEIVNSTTEEEIARHIKEDKAETIKQMARYTRQLRRRINLSQKEFAHCINVSIETIRNWEQGKRYPSGSARVLLWMLDKDPETVLGILSKEVNFPYEPD